MGNRDGVAIKVAPFSFIGRTQHQLTAPNTLTAQVWPGRIYIQLPLQAVAYLDPSDHPQLALIGAALSAYEAHFAASNQGEVPPPIITLAHFLKTLHIFTDPDQVLAFGQWFYPQRDDSPASRLRGTPFKTALFMTHGRLHQLIREGVEHYFHPFPRGERGKTSAERPQELPKAQLLLWYEMALNSAHVFIRAAQQSQPFNLHQAVETFVNNSVSNIMLGQEIQHPRFNYLVNHIVLTTSQDLLVSEFLEGKLPAPIAMLIKRALGRDSRAYLEELRQIIREFLDQQAPTIAQQHPHTILAHLVALLTQHQSASSNTVFSKDVVVDQLLGILGAGIDTSTITFLNTLFILTHQPELQAQLRAQVRQVKTELGLEQIKTAHEVVAMIDQLPTLRQFYLEMMRLFPSIPVVVRKVYQPSQLAGLDLQPGDLLVASSLYINNPWRRYGKTRRFDLDHPRYPNGPEFTSFWFGEERCLGVNIIQAEMLAFLIALLESPLELVPKDGRYVDDPIDIFAHAKPDIMLTMQPAKIANIAFQSKV